MPLNSNYFTESTGFKKCENWSLRSEDNSHSAIAYFLGHPLCWLAYKLVE